MHFRDHFALLFELPFRSYLADIPLFRKAERAGCEGLITEYEVCDTLKQVTLNKSPELDGLCYEVYLKMSRMFVPILTNVFSHWFAEEPFLVALPRKVANMFGKN